MILAQLLADHISHRKRSIRSLAQDIGIDHNNLWRILNGDNTRADNVLKILVWMLGDTYVRPAKNHQRARH